MRSQLFLLIIGIGLLGCVPHAEPKAEVNELAATIPVTRQADKANPTATPSAMPSPMATPMLRSLDDVRCGNLKNGIEEKSYWVDDFIPGESTIEELLQVIEELPEEKKPIQYGDSSYGNPEGEDYYLLIFDQDVLFLKYDPRLYLGDIINHYGEPVQVTWEVLHRSTSTAQGVSVEEADVTTLFFPQSNALFIAEGQITYFSAETFFEGNVFTSFGYEEVYAEINGKVSSSKEFVQHFPWPCD